MKNLFKVFGIIALVAVIGFTMACGGGDDGTGGGNIKVDYTASSVEDMDTWLASKSPNTAATAYTIKLNVSSLGGASSVSASAGGVLKKRSIYVNLDLSGSTMANIETNSFSNCTYLTGIIIPNSVNNIGNLAFSNCTSLTTITIPFVGTARYGTTNTHFGYIFGVSNAISQSIPSSLKTVIITGGSSIPSDAFNGCYYLTSITIPNTVTSIGFRAFYGCRNLTGITIPASVTSIGNSAFSCSKLTSVTFQGTILSSGFDSYAFLGDLYNKFYATDKTSGTPGTYTRAANGSTWTKQ